MVQKHDQRYKKIFSNPIFIEKLLVSFVNEKFIKDLDFTNMERLDKSFVDSKMKKRESDIIYKINFKGKPIYIYLLLEFQSSVDQTMPLRFLRYILELSESFGKDKDTKFYPAVFPLLLYNGEDKWTAEINPKELYSKTIPEKFIPSFEYYPIIINKIEKKTLLKIHNVVSAIFFLENTSLNEMHKAFDDLIILLKDSSPVEVNGFKVWLNSLLKDRNIDIDEDKLQQLESPQEVLPMFAATLDKMEEEFTYKGKLEGKLEEKKEIAINLLKSSFGFENTSKITGLTIDELKQLKLD
ncbi:Rpn family recombination-promoting nuclease/putative transposase [Thiospirochaeta perfilievii]|nr:Rpn family recombination-promoting nuclease/putative transposase [Thiospirochaeta perfilievii]